MTENINKCLLASILNETEYFDKAKNNGNIFLDNECKELFTLMLEIKTNNKQIIIDYYKKNNPDKIDGFLELYNYYYDRDQFNNYYNDVLSTYIKLKIYDKAKNLIKDKSKSIVEVKQEILSLITDISLDEESNIICIQDILFEILNNSNTICKLVPSGMEYFDDKGGYECDELIILAARPSVGKTSKALNIMLNNLKQDQKIGFFSMETNRKKCISIMACSISGIEEYKYRTNTMTDQEKIKFYSCCERLYEKKLFIDDTANLDIEQLKRKARIMKNKYKVDLIYIDYLQLISVHDKSYRNRYEQITYISNSLKRLCRELETPIIALAQVNRENEKDNRPPKKSDLRDSGAIEQDADIIILLHSDNPMENISRLLNIVAKNRNGAIGDFTEMFDKKIRRVSKYQV